MKREVPAFAKSKGAGRLEQEWCEPALPWLCLLLGERVEDQGISMTCFLMYFQGAGDTRELSWELAEKFPERQRQGQLIDFRKCCQKVQDKP